MGDTIVSPRRRAALVSGVVVLAVACASCAALTGIGGYSACDDPCGAEAGDELSAEPPADTGAGEDATLPETSTKEDAGAAPDVQADRPEVSPPDAACDTCVPDAAPAGCDAGGGGDCPAVCAAGRLDCNGAASDGCECAGVACCASECPTAHANGAGGTFYDCAARNTHDSEGARAACASFTGDSGACSEGSVNCGCAGFCSPAAHAVCGSKGGACHCWQFDGPNAGTVQGAPPWGGCAASCGSSSDPTWN